MGIYCLFKFVRDMSKLIQRKDSRWSNYLREKGCFARFGKASRVNY